MGILRSPSYYRPVKESVLADKVAGPLAGLLAVNVAGAEDETAAVIIVATAGLIAL